MPFEFVLSIELYLYCMARFLTCLTVLLIVGCTDAPDFDEVPELTYQGVFNDTLAQSIDRDTVFIQLTVTDADGDLGRRGNGDIEPNIFMIDEYDGFEAATFQLPMFSQQGIGKGIKAEITLSYIVVKGDACCRQPNGTRLCDVSMEHPVDSLFYDMYVLDHAGHESNHVRVGPIYLLCDDPN